MAKTTVPSQYIADNAVTTAKIAANAITAAQIAGGAIVSVDLGDNSITVASIAGNAVGSSEIAANAVGNSQIAANAVDSAEIVGGSIDTVHLSADAVNGTKIADDSIDSEHYVDGSIDTAHIGDSQVTNAKLANSSVTVNSNSLSLGGTLTLDTDDIGEGSTNQYFTNARAQSAISAGTGITVSSGEISIAGNAITATMIAANAVGSSEIAANSVDSAEIAANAVSTSELASTAAPTFASITTTGNGDIGGNLTVTGNLQVDGTTTTINSTNLEVDDLNITVAAGAANAAAADGAGITVDGANATITYDGTTDKWDFNKFIEIGSGYGGTPNTESQLILNDSGNNYITIGSGATSEGGILFADSGDNDVGVIAYNHNTNSLVFRTNAVSNRMIIDSSGLVGIGTSSPSHGLTVSDALAGTSASRRITIQSTTHGVNAGYRFNTESANGTGRAGGLYYEPSDTAGASYIGLTGDDANSHFAVLESGKIGIGTTTPQTLFETATTGTTTNRLTVSSANEFTQIWVEDDDLQGILWKDGSDFTFGPAADVSGSGWGEYLRIKSGGNVNLTGSDLYFVDQNKKIAFNAGNSSSNKIGAWDFSASAPVNPRAYIEFLGVDANQETDIVFYTSDSSTTVAETLRITEGHKLLLRSQNGSYTQFQINSPAQGEASMSFNSGGNGNERSATNAYTNTAAIGLGAWGNSNSTLVIGTNQPAMYIDNTQKVGIGTSSPRHKLSVNGTLGSSTFSGFGMGVVGGLATAESDDTNRAIGLQATSSTNSKLFSYDYGASAGIPISIQPDNADVYLCANGGDVGIGTTNPGAKLDVLSSTALISQFTRNGVATYDFTVTDGGDGAAQLYINAQTTNTGYNIRPKNASGTNIDALFIDPDGNIGLGTTIPGHRLHLLGGNAHTNLVVSTNDGYKSEVRMMEDAGGTTHGGFIRYDGNGDYVQIGHYNSGTEMMGWSMDDAGNIAVGATNASGHFEVHGGRMGIISTSSSWEQLRIANSSVAEAGIAIMNGCTANEFLADDSPSFSNAFTLAINPYGCGTDTLAVAHGNLGDSIWHIDGSGNFGYGPNTENPVSYYEISKNRPNVNQPSDYELKLTLNTYGYVGSNYKLAMLQWLGGDTASAQDNFYAGIGSTALDGANNSEEGSLDFYVRNGADSDDLAMQIIGKAGTGIAGGGQHAKSVMFPYQGIAIDRVWAGYPGISVFNSSDAGSSLQGEFRFHGTNSSSAAYPGTSGSDFSVVVRSDGGYATGSDRRRKRNITTIDSALDTVKQLTGKRFQTVNRVEEVQEKVSKNGYKFGFIAQEVEDIIPEAVQYHADEDDGTEGWNSAYAMDYGSVVALLVNAIKEQDVVIQDLKSRIEALEE